jgi:predicted RNase H-like HicB family nuclease
VAAISISQSATIKCQERTVKSYVFEVVIEEDQFEDGRPGFSAHCPSIEGAYTWGETRDQALERIQEAVKLILDEMRDEGKPVPPNSAVMELESPAVLVTV